MANHQLEHVLEELKDDMMKKTIKPPTLEKRKLKAKKKEIMKNNDEASFSSHSSSTSSNPNYTRRVSRVAQRLRNPTVKLGMARRSVWERQAEALALPLGMSIAAFTNLVIERTNAAGRNVYVDDLAVISTSAVKESLANVYGDKLGSFATNFERSFKSTLKILRLINGSAFPQPLSNNNVASFDLDRSTIKGCSDTELSGKETSSATSFYEEIQGGARTTPLMNDIVLHQDTRQLHALPRSSAMSLDPTERYLQEKARSNDLKCIQIGVSVETNNLMRSKLQKDDSKAAYREHKYKTELEGKKETDMDQKNEDWLRVSVSFMLAAMLYGASVFSQQRIKEATSICETSEENESNAWWFPAQLSWINTEFNIFICRLQVGFQNFSGVLLFLAFAYIVIQRIPSTKQTIIPFIIIFLAFVCGFLGKLCVDTLGGNGKLWLCLWEVFCLLQFLANVFKLALNSFIFGPSQGTKPSRWDTVVPYWIRRSFFFGVTWFVLPAITGLLPFATVGELWDHFAVVFVGLVRDYK